MRLFKVNTLTKGLKFDKIEISNNSKGLKNEVYT
jgi:hypothetical protein